MGLKCAIVSRILAASVGPGHNVPPQQRGRGRTEGLPAWVSRHVSHCDSCASDAAAYALLQTAIREEAGPTESPSLTWHELRSTLPTRIGRERRLPVPALVGAAVVMAAAMVVGVSILPHGVTKPVQIVSRPQPMIRQTHSQPAHVVEEPGHDSCSPVVRVAQKRPLPKPMRRPLPPPRLQARQVPATVNKMTPPAADGEPALAAADAPNNAPRYTVVGAEEHVIKVVGATPVGAPETPDTDYVIRHTDTGDARPVLL